MTVVRGLSQAERRMLLDEQRDLREQLRPGALDDLMTLERSAVRRAISERLAEIEEELEA